MSRSEDRAHAESDEAPTDRPGASRADDEGSAQEGGPWRRALRDIAPYLDLGWRLMGVAAFPPLIGACVDWQLQTAPWGLFVGAAIGLVGSGLQLRRLQHEFRS
ncbi:hypothetical protein [Salinibacter ruber]|uniref:hypothetical protein n=1 Tax=Salinibacter ruber TaxID=146919 RepID=UPI0021672236|nr:hypothetical protein [Salinibacter ruber]MCS3755366.1 hypothetical protein [Salinibacter ruber]MCS3955037.1 hypothetical protein [Salinibacter ruber]